MYLVHFASFIGIIIKYKGNIKYKRKSRIIHKVNCTANKMKHHGAWTRPADIHLSDNVLLVMPPKKKNQF